MEASSAVACGRDNTAIIPPLSGATASSASNDYGANAASLNNGSSSGGPNGYQGATSRSQQLKITNGTTANGNQSQRTTSNQTTISARQKKAAAGVELKSKIIEFMRDKPYLWNKYHPGYNDNKRRESEFGSFSQQIGYPVAEIKRVWHVLRTNFFRAHKIQGEKEPNNVQNVRASIDSKGERCWKYYQSMKFILDGSLGIKIKDEVSKNNNKNMRINDDSSSSVKDVRQTRSSKVLKVARGPRKMIQRMPNQSLTSHCSDSSSNNSSTVPSALLIIPATTPTTAILSTSTPSVSVASDSNVTFSSGAKSNHSNSGRANHDEDHETSVISNISSDHLSLAQGRPSTYSAFNGMSRISFDADDDHLYARSLTATLKKFDPTTKEVIKLKFQEIIVEYMQKQQQQLQSYQAQLAITQPRQAQE